VQSCSRKPAVWLTHHAAYHSRAPLQSCMQVTPSTYPSRGGLLLCKLSKAKMPQGVARFNELDDMIYYFRKDMMYHFHQKFHVGLCMHVAPSYYALIIDAANQARIESGQHVTVALFRRSTLHFFAFQQMVADTVPSTHPTQRTPFSSFRGEEPHHDALLPCLETCRLLNVGAINFSSRVVKR